MEELGKKRLAAAAAVVAGIVYFVVCAFPLRREYVLEPIWTRGLDRAPATAGARPARDGAAYPFRLGGRYGYYEADGRLLFAESAPYGVALAKDAYAAYEQLSTGFVVRAPGGTQIARVSAPGYPFFAAGRRFVLGPDQCSVSELRGGGSVAWKRDFASVVTAFGASPSLAVFGLMDGTLVGVDETGQERLSFAPGGSRIPGIYGVAVSPDGLLVAAICGLDKQRLVVLERRSAAYRVTFHRWLESDFRRPVSIAFTRDGRRLVYEAPGGAGVYDVDSRKESLIATGPLGGAGAGLDGSRVLVLLAGSGSNRRLVCAALPDRRLVDLPIAAQDAFLEVDGRSLFIGADSHIVRLDLREE